MGIIETLAAWKSGLAKTHESVAGRLGHLVRSRGTIDAQMLESVEEILLLADVGPATTAELLRNLSARVKQDRYESSERLVQFLKEEAERMLQSRKSVGGAGFSLPTSPRPSVTMVVGVNGSGKTTTVGKLAFRYRGEGYRVMVGAADTFRAASNEQVEIWSRRAGVELVRQSHGADPASVAFDALASAISRAMDILIVDTAGRLHTRANLMEELKKIQRALDKKLRGAPHEVLLVLDGSTGQNAVQQARMFSSAVNVTGLVLTKLDGTAKGGVVLAVTSELDIPVKFVGFGEGAGDLQKFDSSAFAEALFSPLDIPQEAERT